MADQKEVRVTQQTAAKASLNEAATQAVEPVYTVPPEQQTQFEVCILNPSMGQRVKISSFTTDEGFLAMALAQTHGSIWPDYAGVLGVNGNQLPS
jgi:hypothetical protein